MTNQGAKIELACIDETLNRIQALAVALGRMMEEESSASYLVGMIEDLASNTRSRNELGRVLDDLAAAG